MRPNQSANFACNSLEGGSEINRTAIAGPPPGTFEIEATRNDYSADDIGVVATRRQNGE
jgi:hypothetical protein